MSLALQPAVQTGQSLRRREDPRLLRGEGSFAADVRRPGMLHAAVLRSPHAHARVVGIDAAAARASAGVVEILTYEDALDVRIPMRMSPIDSMTPFLQRPLACDEVRYVGEPVAVVVAASRPQAEDALELIEVNYDPLPSSLAPMAQGTPTGPSPDPNIAASYAIDCGDVDQALKDADVVVRAAFKTQRHTGMPMETRGLVAEWDTARSILTMWGTAKVPFYNRGVIAQFLGLPDQSVHFVQSDVGGAFGVRGELYPEDYLIPLLAMRIGRPVQWIEDRREHFLATNHSRQSQHESAIGVMRDGRITGIHNRFWLDQGAYVRTHGATVPNNVAGYLPGPYKIPNYRAGVTVVLTNKTPAGTYRGPGRFEANFVRERLIDMAARAIGMDPAEIRRRNFIRQADMPYEVGTTTLGKKVVYDDGDFGRLFDRALARFGYERLREEQRLAREQGRCVGIGLAFFVEKSGLGPWESAKVSVDASGKVVVDSGIPSVGQGMETIFAQICGDTLGVSYDEVAVRYGDTERLPSAIGAFASRGTVLGGSAVLQAATKVRNQILELAARELEAAPEDLVLRDGRVSVAGSPDRSVSLGALAGAGIEALDVYELQKMTYAYGMHLVLLEVDRETGDVDIKRYQVDYDIGRAINPALVLGQLAGGLAQGFGGTLLEELRYSNDGQLETGSFMDYLIPTAVEIPDVDLHVSEDCPSKLNPLGVKGAGEGGTVAVAPAIANAVADALGTEINALPIDPLSVWEGMRLKPMPSRP